ncbi:MAG: hypothetical protein ABIP48_30455 [Planctomycetota bacterium]
MAKTATIQAQQRWEYLAVVKRTDTALTNDLNQLGQNGWELVSVIYGKDRKGELAWTGFLKRPAAQHAHGAPVQEQGAEARSSQEPVKAEPAETAEGFDLSGEEFKIQE